MKPNSAIDAAIWATWASVVRASCGHMAPAGRGPLLDLVGKPGDGSCRLPDAHGPPLKGLPRRCQRHWHLGKVLLEALHGDVTYSGAISMLCAPFAGALGGQQGRARAAERFETSSPASV